MAFFTYVPTMASFLAGTVPLVYLLWIYSLILQKLSKLFSCLIQQELTQKKYQADSCIRDLRSKLTALDEVTAK